MAGADRHTPIGDYALIGDCRGAGLVSRDGSLDWLCLPRFDSPALFAALLDSGAGGCFRVGPAGNFRAERRYLPDTNIVETTFHCPGGTVALRDLLAVGTEEERRADLAPEQEVLREVAGLAGEVEIEIHYEPHPGYGRHRPALRDRGAFGIWGKDGGAAYVLRSDLPLTVAGDGNSAGGRARVRAGERRHLSLTHGADAPAVIPPLGEHAAGRVERAGRWWRELAGRCAYLGPYREAVVRSALVLKLLTYAPSGAVVAAPTTSLPERIGGVRNWDYRYCWLRDASFTVRALLALGYGEEATAFLGWLLHATRLTWPELQVVYDVFGEARLPERELPHLAGQLQLDVYGEVLDAVARLAGAGGRFDRDTVRLLDGDDLDASLLTLPLYGYADAAHPRMRGTVARIREHLGRGDLIYRYAEGTDDGLAAGEGAFGICGFWAVARLARAGEIDEAARIFERLLGRANDAGLYGEEIDPATGAALGNFPQAFTHIGLINAALTLAECRRDCPPPARGSREPGAAAR